MELWKQLRQAGLVPPGLGPPPRALRGVPPVEKVGQTLASPGAGAGGARESLLWIWEELVHFISSSLNHVAPERVWKNILGRKC